MKQLFTSLDVAERRYVIIGGVVLAVILGYFLGYEPLALQNTKLQSVVERQAEDLRWMQHARKSLATQDVAAPVPVSNKPLLVIVDQTIQQAGLKALLKRVQPEGTTKIRVWIEQAPFANLVQWLDDLQRNHGVVVDTAGIEREQNVGTVNAKLVLAKADAGAP